MSVQIIGIGVSRGIAIGKAHILQRGELDIAEYRLAESELDAEIRRFRDALEIARAQLREIRNRIPPGTQADIVEFIDAHLLMLEDSTLTIAPEHLIRSQSINAEWALKQQRDALVQVFEEMDDAYLRTRKDDIDHVVGRILRILLNDEVTSELPDDDSQLAGTILLADELTPADTVLMQHQGIAAFVTEYGAPLSHTAIIARSLRIPAVVGVHNVRRYIRDNETLIVDGERGLLIAAPDAGTLAYYRERQAANTAHYNELRKLTGKPATTRDGVRTHLYGNIELPEDVGDIMQVGAEGVGLYRTEFMYMNRPDVPSEEEQLERYVDVIHTLKGLPLTIRTLDLGADKAPDEHIRPCVNPALGLRAVRLCLRDHSLFRPQLRAILRAAAEGPVRLMIPMLSNIQEVLQVLELLRDIRNELSAEGLPFDPTLPVGGMIEVPAAALAADFFARHLDFLSIGTNDLIQYTLAIDRVDEEVNYLYEPTHPAVLRLIQMVIQAGEQADIPISMCGEMAGDALYTPLLLGLGLRHFSMQAASLLEVKSVIKGSEACHLQDLVTQLMQTHEPEQRIRLREQLGIPS